ncbi:hypothetical protein [Candidatus Pantoea persica]|uniref:hypothetical protein n=1 Tax=Candidatus Pantoea persica TaxID=2518128 RepID=UPI00215D6BB4|nr:hypothetical protein [Candidatus Pantoea persica]MBA2814419.1 Enoyl-[acyl-carrier-protein] reductase [NADH] FabI [Candidatus Pantoea persica]
MLIEKLGINSDLTREKLSANYRDARINAIVSLDLGLAPGFTQQSLRQIDIPVLILATQGDNVIRLSAAQESGYLAAWMLRSFNASLMESTGGLLACEANRRL